MIDILKLEDVLTFGKHKGKTVEYVIEHYPKYVNWCLDNEIFDLTSKGHDLLEEYLNDLLDWESEMYGNYYDLL